MTRTGLAGTDSSGGLTGPYVDLSLLGAAPAAPATGKTRLYVDSNGLLQLLPATGPSRRIAAHWGTGTAFPTGAAAGDTFIRTDIGTNGTLYQYSGSTSIGTAGWIVEGPITCTLTTRPTTGLYAGVQLYETDTGRVYEYIPAGVTVNGTALAAALWDQVGGPPEQYAINYAGGGGYFAAFGAANYQGAVVLKRGRDCWIQGIVAPGPTGGVNGTSMTANTQYTVGGLPAQVVPVLADQGACAFYPGTGAANYYSTWVITNTAGATANSLFVIPSVATSSPTAWQLSLTGARWRTNG